MKIRFKIDRISIINRRDFGTCESLFFAKCLMWKWDYHQIDDPRIHKQTIPKQCTEAMLEQKLCPNDTNNRNNDAQLINKWIPNPSWIHWTNKSKNRCRKMDVHKSIKFDPWWSKGRSKAKECSLSGGFGRRTWPGKGVGGREILRRTIKTRGCP